MVILFVVWGRVCFSVSCGFDSGRSFLAARLNRLGEWKLVEPTCESQRVGRVETVVTLSGVLGAGSTHRVPVVVSTQPFASLTCWLNRLWKGARSPAQPALEGCSRPGSTSFGKRGILSNCPIRMSRAYLIPHRKALMGPSPRSCRKNGASSLDPAAIDNRVGRPARPRRVVPRVPARPSGSFSQQPRYR